MGTYAIDLQTMGIGLLLVRVVIGFVMAAHGARAKRTEEATSGAWH
jgi:hypothetical protein